MNKLHLESKERNGSAVVYLDGYLNENGGELLEQECRSLLGRGCRELQLDFARTSMVNSIGISYLLDVIESAVQDHARLELVAVPEDIRQLFDLLGISGRVPVKQP